MTDTRGTGQAGSDVPLVSEGVQPDWAALAERHHQQVHRRRQIRVVVSGVVAAAAVGGIVVTAAQVSGATHKPGHTNSTAITSLGSRGATGDPSTVTVVTGDDPTAGASSASATDPASSAGPSSAATAATPSAGASGAAPATGGGGAAAGPANPAAPLPGAPAAPGAPVAGNTPAAPAAVPTAAPQPAPTPTKAPPPPAPTGVNPYSAGQVCGSGYAVIDSHNLGAATIYLLYSNATGNNCVVTLAAHTGGAVAMNATLSVKGGGSSSNPGNFTYYAGPVTEHAPKTCIEFGGSYQGTTWTSPWSHCS
ncbi:hypothetical protein P3T36_007329 [Kitasatospora sp. MAP12-15]|uniref:hypothetical protein n=1 Tax=unclassified Kitasatospora TaxID=2633591 RepID=UPI00247445E2|nr:hypothetical protein [Kitasatospora sp. MAP12-44]MDH6115040.1 hypothetical protein [Kitasatospora sp. MAP12-44]